MPSRQPFIRGEALAGQFAQTTRSLGSDTSKYALVAWALAGLLMTGWMLWFFLGSVTVYEMSTRARVEVREASHPLPALIASKIVSTALKIGSEVQAGDVLVELDASTETLRLREEQARLDTMPLRIASLRREIEAHERTKTDDTASAAAAAEVATHHIREADVALEFAKETERRFAQLTTSGTVSRVDAMRALNDSQKLTASRDAAVADIKRIELDAQSRAHQHDAQIENLRQSIVTLEGDIATSQATIARLKVDIEKHLVRAPISGRIGDVVPLPAGAYVAEGQQLATIVPQGDLIVAADFSPSLTLGRVQTGQKGRLRLDGFPWAQYGTVSATVSRVASEIRDGVMRVELTPDAAAPSGITMQHGLPGTVEVSVEEASPATLLLRAAGLLFSSAPRPTRAVAELAR
jgi:multidrug resistance efflux pump